MKEIEIKLQLGPGHWQAVQRWVLGPGKESPSGSPIGLQARYFDTPERTLARAGLALRMRREGQAWVQTLKGDLGDGLSRAEHEVHLGAQAASPPALDVGRHAHLPLGQRLLGLLAPQGGVAALQCTYQTDIERLSRRLRLRAGVVELALDAGRIEAGGAVWPVGELEIESVCGRPQAVLNLAHLVMRRWGLWIDTRSKAERGDLLARGLRHSPPMAVAPQASRPAAFRALLAAASQVASGEFEAPHAQALAQAAAAYGLRLPPGLPLVQGVRSLGFQRALLAGLRASLTQSKPAPRLAK
jgi:triphosphatase